MRKTVHRPGAIEPGEPPVLGGQSLPMGVGQGLRFGRSTPNQRFTAFERWYVIERPVQILDATS